MSKLIGSCVYEKDERETTHTRSLTILPDDDVEVLQEILASELADNVTRKDGRIVPDSIKMRVEA